MLLIEEEENEDYRESQINQKSTQVAQKILDEV